MLISELDSFREILLIYAIFRIVFGMHAYEFSLLPPLL